MPMNSQVANIYVGPNMISLFDKFRFDRQSKIETMTGSYSRSGE